SAAPVRAAGAAANRTEPAAAVAANREGEALFERGDVEGAVARFRRAVAAAPGNAYYHNNLGWALFQLGRVDEAGRELAQAVRLDPRRDIAYANIGEVERAKGNVQGAIAAYERFLQLNTDPRREQIAREKLRRLRGG
ncbi:MAG TPA: tetratricopeptide repeat protein, partial [Longimicrobiaceae bacterium]